MDDIAQRYTTRESLKRLSVYWLALSGRIACAVVLMSVATCINLWIPLLVKKLLEDVTATGALIAQRCAFIIALFATYHFISLCGHFYSDTASHRVAGRILSDVMKAANRVEWKCATSLPAAQYAAELHKAAMLCCEATTGCLTNLFSSLIKGVGYAYLVVTLAPGLCALFVSVFVASHLFERWYQGLYAVDGKSEMVAESRVSGLLCNAFQRCATIRIFRARPFIENEFEKRLKVFHAAQARSDWGVHSNCAMRSGVTNCTAIVLIGATAWYRSQGTLQLGDLVILFFYMQGLLTCLTSVWNHAARFGFMVSRVSCVWEILDKEAEGVAREEAHEESCHRLSAVQTSAVEFACVCATYDVNAKDATGACVLEDASFTIQSGQFIGVVGPSGAGKSTILRLIAGLITPARGTVTVAQRVALLEQSASLLPGTVQQNIEIGKPGSSLDEIVSAAKKCGCHDFVVSLPDGYNTLIENIDSAALSGGQLQRICLARVFISDAPIVLLDEPTNALDAASEKLLLEAIWLLRAEGRTVLLATHKLNVVAGADAYLTIGDGHVNITLSCAKE